MRLSKKHFELIELMESSGYVWLSHLSPNAIMRFRNRTRKGFNHYFKVEGLTFLTQRVADMISIGTKSDKPRLTAKEQNAVLMNELAELERKLYVKCGVGQRKVKNKAKKTILEKD